MGEARSIPLLSPTHSRWNLPNFRFKTLPALPGELSTFGLGLRKSKRCHDVQNGEAFCQETEVVRVSFSCFQVWNGLTMSKILNHIYIIIL